MKIDFYKMIKFVEYFVEASSFEKSILYREALDDDIEWKLLDSRLLTVNCDKYDQPIIISIQLIELKKHYVCLYYPSSNLVDYSLVKTSLKKTTGNKNIKFINAMNFHVVLSHVKKSDSPFKLEILVLNDT